MNISISNLFPADKKINNGDLRPIPKSKITLLQSSGVGICSEALQAFDELKFLRKYAFIVYCISEDGTKVQVEKAMSTKEADTIGSYATYNNFLESLPADQGRYAVYDLAYVNGIEGIRSRLIFVMWYLNHIPYL